MGRTLPTHVRAKLAVYGLRHGDDETTIDLGLDKRGYPATAKFLRGGNPKRINQHWNSSVLDPPLEGCRVWAIKRRHPEGGQMSFVSGTIGCMTPMDADTRAFVLEELTTTSDEGQPQAMRTAVIGA